MNVTDPNASGAGEGTGTGDGGDTVKHATYLKLLDEKKTRDRQLADAKAELDKIREDDKSRTEKDMEDKQQYKTLLEIRTKERDEANVKLADYDKNVKDSRKLDAFLKTVNGTVAREYWGLVDLSEIATNPETGEIDESSVTTVVERFTTAHARLIDRPGGRTGLPNGAPSGTRTMTHAEWMKLPTAAEKRAKLKEVMANDRPV